MEVGWDAMGLGLAWKYSVREGIGKRKADIGIEVMSYEHHSFSNQWKCDYFFISLLTFFKRNLFIYNQLSSFISFCLSDNFLTKSILQTSNFHTRSLGSFHLSLSNVIFCLEPKQSNPRQWGTSAFMEYPMFICAHIPPSPSVIQSMSNGN